MVLCRHIFLYGGRKLIWTEILFGFIHVPIYMPSTYNWKCKAVVMNCKPSTCWLSNMCKPFMGLDIVWKKFLLFWLSQFFQARKHFGVDQTSSMYCPARLAILLLKIFWTCSLPVGSNSSAMCTLKEALVAIWTFKITIHAHPKWSAKHGQQPLSSVLFCTYRPWAWKDCEEWNYLRSTLPKK